MNTSSKKSLTKMEPGSKSFPKEMSSNRVIAPFVKIVKRGGRVSVSERVEESKYESRTEKRLSTIIDGMTTFLTDSVDFVNLFRQTVDVLKMVTNAAKASLYLVNFREEEICYQPENNNVKDEYTWKIQQGSTIASYVAFKKELIQINDYKLDGRFPDGVGFKVESISSILSVPVVTPEGDCFAVMELYKLKSQPTFEKDHVKIVVGVTGWMGAAVHQNQLRLILGHQQKLTDHLLYLTKCYFGGSGTIEKLLTALMKFAKETLDADRSCVYVIDKDNDVIIADMYEEGIEDSELHRKNIKVRITKNRAIVNYVVRTGNTVNIKDPDSDKRFRKDVEQRPGSVTTTILCMAVKSFDDTLGVIQVMNKRDGFCFTKTDEENLSTFAAYCGLNLHYYNLKKQADKTRRLNNCHLKLLTRQMEPCIHDLTEFAATPDVPIPKNFQTFRWYVTPETTYLLPNYAYFMIIDIVGRDNILIDKLQQFILTCKKNYQLIAYHNFEHGFNVCHCMYNILSKNMSRFSIVESKSLIVAALCHDVDHPGYTNNYLSVTRDNLALLYEESILENHHYRTTLVMLNYCNVYANVNENMFKQICKEIKEAIIATDLALYFRFRGRLAQIVKDGVLEFGNTAHRSLVKAIMMTSCDLSGQCKPFHVARRITENVYLEFYKQGDEEKSRGTTPLSMMDREKHHMIPEDQVQFLSVVVLPCVDILQKIFPATSEMYETASTLQKDWQTVIELRNTLGKPWQQVIEEDMPMVNSSDSDNEVELDSETD